MRTARSSSHLGGLYQAPPGPDPPLGAGTPLTRHPPRPGIPQKQAPPRPGTPRPGTPPVNRMTDRCKNITFPQTSFAGGNEFYGKGAIV